MTLAKLGVLFEGERNYFEPKKVSGDAPEGTAADLAMFASMKVG